MFQCRLLQLMENEKKTRKSRNKNLQSADVPGRPAEPGLSSRLRTTLTCQLPGQPVCVSLTGQTVLGVLSSVQGQKGRRLWTWWKGLAGRHQCNNWENDLSETRTSLREACLLFVRRWIRLWRSLETGRRHFKTLVFFFMWGPLT